MHRRTLTAAGLALAALPARLRAAEEPLRCAVGPVQPTAEETRRLYRPFFAHLAEAVGRPLDLTVTPDWAGIALALATNQVDLAWMGPWSYLLAKERAGAEALAVVTYQGKPTYQALILARQALKIGHFPEDAKGLSIAFADAGSTSGWLIPHYWFRQHGIDPTAYFRYQDGNSHAANTLAVANGQVDLATDDERSLATMIAAGRLRPNQLRIVWRSDPLPNDALAVRAGLDPALKARLREAALAIDEAKAAQVMPPGYTGWVAARPDSYAVIETAGRTLLGSSGAG
ncbi:phosphate/phosphite/phosphonate ABC transporter substrate-binding protein [Roseicella frigidaeris]|uniref:Phosphonate ABC transporter n=1 Tax=Roseicella frigidaeris TaxID=2230885 RepID=A0A327M622_9PROT|nr:phosphate/phosphite/phosphonate ABC transporter substrate-binding protein [Roseicella frigidaeris]RAI57742.1 phosphonate ABC transporter [Roseicella frigidaeris]